MFGWILLGLIFLLALGVLLYWLLVVTEGVYLGRRLVVAAFPDCCGNHDIRDGYYMVRANGSRAEPSRAVAAGRAGDSRRDSLAGTAAPVVG